METFDAELVSIITPVFNSEPYIVATIQSALAQSHTRWEMLCLIDKGSKDRTEEIIERFAAADSRIRLVWVPNGRNVSDARNFGFTQAKGRYIAFLDADDLWLPKKLERQLAFMRRNGVAMSFTGFRRISQDGLTVGHKIEVPQKITYSDLLKKNSIGCLTVVIDQSQTGRLVMGDTIHEDYSLWLSLLRTGHSAAGLREDLARYRVVKGSRASSRLANARWRWQVYRRKEGLSRVVSAYYLISYVLKTLGKHTRF